MTISIYKVTRAHRCRGRDIVLYKFRIVFQLPTSFAKSLMHLCYTLLERQCHKEIYPGLFTRSVTGTQNPTTGNDMHGSFH